MRGGAGVMESWVWRQVVCERRGFEGGVRGAAPRGGCCGGRVGLLMMLGTVMVGQWANMIIDFIEGDRGC
ncbi:hypothetical protein [Bartonella tribocorum]|uniref:Uncharacterized protein n=1 Tax=Bartonella tribocorum TaxID=85701 RepID=A0A2M6USP3_9HYPH|nr:hypothetical protein [Bartonella tribocorum]PIT69164.1 hypothetical protein CEV08_06720 [Bartonella tribocorum]